MESILITAIGSAAGDITIKTLHQYGYRIIGTDIYPKEWLIDSFRVDYFYKVPIASNSDKYIQEILKICDIEKIRYIIPLTDVEVDVLNESRQLFKEIGVKLCISDKDTILKCRDKRCSASILEGCCRTIPEIRKGMVSAWYDFPVICKPVNGRSSNGIYKFYSLNELKCFLENIKDDYIVQPFLEGEIITADVVRDKESGSCVVIAREELLRAVNGLGTTVKIFYDEKFENMCIAIAEKLDICGCVNFEFIRDIKGLYYFLECNPRFSGGVEFSVLSGYNCIINHLKCFQGKRIDDKIIPREKIIVRKYEEYVTKIYD